MPQSLLPLPSDSNLPVRAQRDLARVTHTTDIEVYRHHLRVEGRASVATRIMERDFELVVLAEALTGAAPSARQLLAETVMVAHEGHISDLRGMFTIKCNCGR